MTAIWKWQGGTYHLDKGCVAVNDGEEVVVVLETHLVVSLVNDRPDGWSHRQENMSGFIPNQLVYIRGL